MGRAQPAQGGARQGRHGVAGGGAGSGVAGEVEAARNEHDARLLLQSMRQVKLLWLPRGDELPVGGGRQGGGGGGGTAATAAGSQPQRVLHTGLFDATVSIIERQGDGSSADDATSATASFAMRRPTATLHPSDARSLSMATIKQVSERGIVPTCCWLFLTHDDAVDRCVQPSCLPWSASSST